MKLIKKTFEQINIYEQCRKYNVPLWQCPQFLFMIMGLIIIASALTTYLTGNRYINDPLMVALITMFLVALLLAIAFLIVNSFERLAEVNKMKTEFITIATHQLRSPLSNLRWVIELLISGKLKDEERKTEYFKILKENISRMQESISDLLIVSRIESDKLPIKEKEFSLKKMFEDLITEYQSFAQASNVKIYLEAEDSLPNISSDPMQVRLIIDNLLDNAVRYIDKGGKVKIEMTRQKNNIYCSIKDSGVGIPINEQKYIFQKFFRSKKITEHQTHGSGLGLYISKTVIRKLKGKIGFQSQEGTGSTFWFTLPIKS